ncbi:MAG: TonB-dependent receptor [Veillonellaceae bacterium]|nr:TonB-dependent receptor [Veillonellaceae bacterium]
MQWKKKSLLFAVLTAVGSGVMIPGQAAYDENLKDYTLDAVIVEADRIQNQFGDTITEQSYYRTGGDVKVITREEIEKRHYTDLTEAIKRIPGVTFQNPGYRGGEYGYSFYNNGVSINGDTRVIILVDGRRVDNAASTRINSTSGSGSKSTGVNLDQVTSIENVEKIEVIKGPGASAYGADATGGVINIITRKGSNTPEVTVDLATGSWQRHNYSLAMSGTVGESEDTHYFLSLSRKMSGDTEYRDAATNTTGTLGGSNWREQAASIRVDKKLSDTKSIRISYNYTGGKDGYPIAVPNLKYWNEKDWKRIIFAATVGTHDENYKLTNVQVLKDRKDKIIYGKDGKPIMRGNTKAGDMKNPGYHNLFALDGKAYGSFSKFNNNDWDLVYTFNRVNGMESFVRLYSQNHRYLDRDKFSWSLYRYSADEYLKTFPNGTSAEEFNKWIDTYLAPFPGGDPDRLRDWVEKTGGRAANPTSWQEEKNYGIQLQWANSSGQHDVIASVTLDQARNYAKRIENVTNEVKSSYVKRNSVYGYVQDKIHVNDSFDVTPALRFTKYNSFENRDTEGNITNSKGSSHSLTPSLHMQYKFDDTLSSYLGWTKIQRPLRMGDYSLNDGVFGSPLRDEKGNAVTLGVRKTFNDDRTSLAVHYDITKMSNAIATLPVLQRDGTTKSLLLNAKEDKQSFNVTLDHQLANQVTLSASYSHMYDKWMAQKGITLDPKFDYSTSSDINTAINYLRPANKYSLNITYDNDKLYTGLLINWYTGQNLNAFTAKRFLVMDWNLNYRVTKNATAYIVITNLTDEAYETSYNAWNGVGALAMPGRAIMGGVRYQF